MSLPAARSVGWVRASIPWSVWPPPDGRVDGGAGDLRRLRMGGGGGRDVDAIDGRLAVERGIDFEEQEGALLKSFRDFVDTWERS